MSLNLILSPQYAFHVGSRKAFMLVKISLQKRTERKNGLFLVFILVSVKKIDDGPHRKWRAGIQLSCPMNYVLLYVKNQSQFYNQVKNVATEQQNLPLFSSQKTSFLFQDLEG